MQEFGTSDELHIPSPPVLPYSFYPKSLTVKGLGGPEFHKSLALSDLQHKKS